MSVGKSLAPIVVLLMAGLAACGGADAGAPLSPVTVTVTATETATVTEAAMEATTTSPVAAPTSAQTGPHLGMVWTSQVDPGRINQPAGSQPTFDSDGITSRIELILYVDASAPGDLANECESQLDGWNSSPDATHCLFVQWSFDVPSDYEADDANLSPGPLLTPEGRQIDQGTTTSGVPGAKNVVIGEYYPGGVPGSTLRWDVGSNEQGRANLKFEVPSSESFLPINFD